METQLPSFTNLPDKELLELARLAVIEAKARQKDSQEDIEKWARELAEDLAQFTD